MITRKFAQSWDSTISPINGLIQKDVFEDFFKYLNRMNFDLNSLIRYQKEEFDSLSPKKVDEYKERFEMLRDHFMKICLSDYAFNTNRYSLFDKKNLREGVLSIDGNHHEINKKYYKVLNKIANQIFALEEEMSHIVEKLWQNKLSNIINYSFDGKYSLLAHAEYGPNNYDEYPVDIKEYCENQQGLCFSLITDEKTKLYMQEKCVSSGIVGIIAKPKPGALLAISSYDMLTTEYYKDKCYFDRYFDHSDVNCVFDNGTNKVCSYGTKICCPNCIMETDVDEINELVLNKNLIDVQAVFYVKNASNKIPDKMEEYYKKCVKMFGKKLPIIQVKKRNKLHQINLQDVYY